MIKISIFIFFIGISAGCFSQAPAIFPRVFSSPKGSHCAITGLKVKEVWPATCNLEPGCNSIYPVLAETFDDVFDLPNKWDFRINSSTNNGCTYYYDGYYDNNSSLPIKPMTNHNVQINNGILNLVTIPENITRGGANYSGTSGAITSLSRFRTGTFEASIKVPTCNKLWPAFWLLQKQGAYDEIDIFEFYDNDVSSDPCETYNLHKMTLHTGATDNYSGNVCERGDKYPMNINDWHTYKLDWDEYSMAIYVDGILLGIATKYHQLSSFPYPACEYGSAGELTDPLFNFDCEHLAQQPDNLFPVIPKIDWGPRPWWLPGSISWPPPQPPQPYLANQVNETSYFPDKNSAMRVIFNNAINCQYKDDDLSMFSQSEMTMQIDWLTVSQPFCCGIDKTVCSLTDLENQTYNTDILTGRNLTIGNSNNTCVFQQNHPNVDKYDDVPVVLLATDEIAVNGDAYFPGDTYVEMKIVTCGSSQRVSSDEQAQLTKYFEKQDAVMDSINAPIYDSLVNVYTQHYVDSINDAYSKYNPDPGKDKRHSANPVLTNVNNVSSYYSEITVSPVPAEDYITINANDWQFDKIVSIYITDNAGRKIELKKERSISLDKLAKGSYILKIIMENGEVLNKKIIKI